MARKIVITSGKGGVGKTTISANIGSSLAEQNQKVVILDVDIGLNNLDVVMGIENKIVFDVIDCIEGKCRVRQALIQDFKMPNLYILPSNQSLNATRITGNQIKSIVDELNDMFDYVLIDCPAGIDLGFHRAVFSASEALIVTTPHLSALKDADKVVDILKTYNLTDINLIVNRVRGDLILNKEMMRIDAIANYFDVPLIGVVPDDDNITKSLAQGGAVCSKSSSKIAFNMLASNIISGAKKIYNPTKEFKGLIGYIKRALKRNI